MMKGLTAPQPPPQLLEENMSNLTSASGEASACSSQQQSSFASPHPAPVPAPPSKKKRSLPGNPDPDAEVVALSPNTLMATNRFVCEVCGKGFQRDQNLQLHRRGHNLPWKLKQRGGGKDGQAAPPRKKVYVCPEAGCVHHDPARALGDLTGIKKHFSRKHGEKKWKCDKCSKKYAVQSDWKAHSKVCGTREYRCDCGTLFSRRDSFITHRAFCDALAEESARAAAIGANPMASTNHHHHHPPVLSGQPSSSAIDGALQTQLCSTTTLQDLTHKRDQQQQQQQLGFSMKPDQMPPWLNQLDLIPSMYPGRLEQEISPAQAAPVFPSTSPFQASGPGSCYHMSATALLQKAAQMGATMSTASTRMASSSASGFGFGFEFGLGSSHQEMGAASSSSPPPPHDLQQNMVMGALPAAAHGFDHGAFEEAFGANGNNLESFAMRTHQRNEEGGGGSGDGLTRDFLGLRAFSHGDILSMAAFDACMASSSSYEQAHLSKKPWLG